MQALNCTESEKMANIPPIAFPDVFLTRKTGLGQG